MAQAKARYKAQLAERIRGFLAEHPHGYTFDCLVDFIHGVAFESWKSGVATGKRQERPSMKAADVEGVALESGLLKPPVDQDA